ASLDGRALRAGSAHAALEAGIAAVNQSSLLFERMSWEENLALGGFARGGLDLMTVARRAHELAARLGFALPPPGATVEQRPIGDRVRLELLRALSFDPRALILDEPTGALAPAELPPFLDLLRRLRGEGRIVVLITHKLAEALAVADRVTVLRRGRVVATTTPAESSAAELARLMIGELPAEAAPRGAPQVNPGASVLAIDGLRLTDGGRQILREISLELHGGEITGIAGVDGNGQHELVEILAGARDPSGGRVRAQSLAVIPENRDLDGLVLDMKLWENLLLATPLRESMLQRGFLVRSRVVQLCDDLIRRFRIRAPGPEVPAAALSGGNRQRLEVARALACEPKVIVAHNVCRGLDVAATAEVHRTLIEFANSGGAVLLISSDLDELLTLCGRLLVMSRGHLRETLASERDPQHLGLLMTGQ
ncbi:MAG TPA: ATP-binding cassette domain-containing protein, partial [Candidatus Binataceae bacterium]|nr:ATP-binding cassette domain-containing protein [Candidatus Binataceae bacterium]